MQRLKHTNHLRSHMLHITTEILCITLHRLCSHAVSYDLKSNLQRPVPYPSSKTQFGIRHPSVAGLKSYNTSAPRVNPLCFFPPHRWNSPLSLWGETEWEDLFFLFLKKIKFKGGPVLLARGGFLPCSSVESGAVSERDKKMVVAWLGSFKKAVSK
jgi:hypothetical protein